MPTKKEIKSIMSDVRKWLAKGDNSPVKLAAALGYRTSNSIQQWMTRKSIPAHMIERIKEVIK